MKLALAMLLGASLLQAQSVKPTTLTMTTVPGDFSSSQDVAFINPGSVPITVTVSTTGPFILLKNQCDNGVRADSHCNVYVIYGATAVGEMDTGTLVFSFNQQTITVPLTGYTVSIIGTSMNAVWTPEKGGINVTMRAAGDLIPNGEDVDVNCQDEDGVEPYEVDIALKDNKVLVPGPRACSGQYCEWYACWINYNGDAEFSPSSAFLCVGGDHQKGYSCN
jgi:hypothetical protein